MAQQTPNQLARRSVKNALELSAECTRGFLSYEDMNTLALRAQAQATTAVALALLDIAEILRQDKPA